MIKRVYHVAKREAGTFGRFLLVGGASFLINVGIYALLSRWIYPQGNKVVESTVAFLLSVLFNFAAHRAWTYRGERAHLKQMLRYCVVVGSAALFQTALFWFGHERLKIYDFAVIVLSNGLTALFTFVGHKFYTFRSRTPSEPIS